MITSPHPHQEFGRFSIKSPTEDSTLPVPEELRHEFAPAQTCIYEWTDYFIECSGANRFRVGNTWISPISNGVFRLRFENQLGLTYVQPFSGNLPISAPLYLEVISRKFPTPASHSSVFNSLLEDLFARAARLPFSFSALTSRGVKEAMRPPTPLFAFNFLIHYAASLRTAIATILSAPHRKLRGHETFVPLNEATEADADVMLSILQTPHELVRAGGFLLADRLKGYAPVHVWQSRPEETFDTPENRFVLAFLKDLVVAADSLINQSWWKNVSTERQLVIKNLSSLLRQTIGNTWLAHAGVMNRFPAASRVLMRRDGYRDLLRLWQLYQQARRPLFGALTEAIEVRDVALIYEMWSYFALIEEFSTILSESPAIEMRASDEVGLNWNAEARFGSKGSLVYNKGQKSYSVPLRPDFTWIEGGKTKLILDAKFRLDRFPVDDEDDDSPKATVRRADLYKMHTYRDALGVRAAVIVYPGDVSIFYDSSKGKNNSFSLRDLLFSACSGVGAVAMTP